MFLIVLILILIVLIVPNVHTVLYMFFCTRIPVSASEHLSNSALTCIKTLTVIICLTSMADKTKQKL